MSDLSALVATGLGLLEGWDRAKRLLENHEEYHAWMKWLTNDDGANARALLEGCAAMERERDDLRRTVFEEVSHSVTQGASLDAALVDARRYEWIRLNLCYAIGTALKWPVYPHRDQKAAFDAAIDAAMVAPSSSGDKNA